MTSITLTDEQLDRLADALADRVAGRLADLAPATPRLVDVDEPLAELRAADLDALDVRSDDDQQAGP